MYKYVVKVAFGNILGQKASFLQILLKLSNAFCICWFYCTNVCKITNKDNIHGMNRQEKANAGNVTQKIHLPFKQSTLIHTQTHTANHTSTLLL